MKKYSRSLFIFRRDLRLIDNTALNAALKYSENVIACFIIDPRQVSDNNTYRSNNALDYMLESLQELEKDLQKKHGKLYYFYGEAHNVIKMLIKQESLQALFCNRDYTPFSMERDETLKNLCYKNNIDFMQYDDALLIKPENILTKNGTPYQKFTPFFKIAKTLPIQEPLLLTSGTFYKNAIKNSLNNSDAYANIVTTKNPDKVISGGRKKAISRLKKLPTLKNYGKTRDFPAYATTFLSAAHKFGTISIRESYYAIKKTLGSHHLLLQQLFWRDFFTHIAFHSPFVFGQAFHQKYNDIAWQNDKKFFLAWCSGLTGFPIVDAGMRQLNTTGFMHNRVRMIVGSFLTKDLLIDWKWGERYFAQQLLDYDPCVNNGNWQWVASTGCDAQPYFRIFNPWLQQKKFDPTCVYIKTWIPELRSVSDKDIHSWHAAYKKNTSIKYPKPIINHTEQVIKAKKIYKEAAYGQKKP